mgnify:CR=1 FL=1
MSWFGFKKEWTKKEKIAVLKSICYIIGADEKIMGSEKALLAGYLKKYGLDESSMYEQASMSQTEMSLIISKLSTVENSKKITVSKITSSIVVEFLTSHFESTNFFVISQLKINKTTIRKRKQIIIFFIIKLHILVYKTYLSI